MAALAGTLAFHSLLIIILIAGALRYNSTDNVQKWPPADSSEILLGGEYVMAGDIPEPGLNDIPAATADSETQSTQATEQAEPAPEPLVTSDRQSPAKTEKANTDKNQATKKRDKKDEQARRDAESAKAEKATASRINNRVTFGSGKSGSPQGSDATGAVSGISTGGLGNRHAIDLPRPPRGPLGRIIITIKVDRRGNVTSASFLSGEGAAAASAQARAGCIAAARRARFSESPDAPISQTGTLTYNFK